MPSQVTGASQTALNVYQALYGQAPSNPLLADYKSTITTSGAAAFASQMTAGFAQTKSASLASTVLTNLGVYSDSLSAALTQMFEGYGVASRGQIILNLTSLLSSLEGDVTYGAAAVAYNAKIGNNFTYASNTANTTPGVYTAPVAPVVLDPTYSITSSAASVNEGDSAIFTITTKNVAAGTVLSYALSGVSSADVVGSQLIGTTTVDATGRAVVAVTLAADALTEGAETMTLTAAGKTASVTVNDTSTTPAPVVPPVTPAASYAVTANAATVNEGQSVTYTVTTKNVAAGNYSYLLGGDVKSGDIVGGLTGTVAIDSSGIGYLTVTAVADNTTDGDENMTITIGGTTSATVVRVLDTSKTQVVNGNFPLTAGVDTTLVGGDGNDTFSSTNTVSSTTLSAGDSLVGGNGSDTLAVTTTVAADLGASTFGNSIENISATATGGALTLRLDGYTAVTAVTSQGSTENVTFQGLNTAIPTINVTGTNKDVTVTLAGALTVGTTDSATINLNGVATSANNTITVNGIENLTVNATGASGSLDAGGNIQSQTTIVSDGLRSLTLGGAGTARVKANLAGAGVGTTAAAATVTGSTGADDIEFSVPAAGKVSVNAGTGDDVIRVATLAATTSIAGGDGTDTLVYSGTATVAAAAVANVSGFEKVVISGPASMALATTDLTYTVAAGSTTYTNLAAGSTVNLQQGGTLTLANAALTGATDAVTFNVGRSGSAGTAATAATIAAGEFDVVTVNSLAAPSTLASATAAISVSGTTLNSVTLTAPHGVTLTGGGTALTTINASGVQGNFTNSATTSTTAALTVTGGGGNDAISGGTRADSLVGGAGDDTITGNLGQDTMTGGTGNDVFVFGVNSGTNVVSGAGAVDTITDFETGKDRLSFAQQNDGFVGNVANIQMGLAAMTANNQSFYVTSENQLYVVASRGVLGTNDTIVKLNNVTGVTPTDVGVGTVASGGADITLTAQNVLTQTTLTTGGNAFTAANDTLRATSQAFLSGGTYAGGNGVDTIAITAQTAGGITALNAANITGFERMTLGETTVVGGASVTASIAWDDVNIPSGTFTFTAAGLTTIASNFDGSAIDGSLVAGVAGTGTLNLTGSDFVGAGDTLVGGSFNDTINGGAGNDTITGGAGNDSLIGGLGDDTIVAAGTDTIDGGAGNDVVQVAGALGTSATDLAVIELGLGVNRINYTNNAATTAFATITATSGAYDILVDEAVATATMTPAQYAGAFQVLGVAGGVAEGIRFSSNGTFDLTKTTNITNVLLVSGTTTTGTNTVTVGAAVSITGGTGADTFNAIGGTPGQNFLGSTIIGGTGTDTINITGNVTTTATLTSSTTGVDVIAFSNTTANVSLTTDDANLATATGLSLTVTANSLTTGSLFFNGSGETAATSSYTVSATASTTGADTLIGGAGNDVFNAGNGANTFTGNAGSDSVTGGTGNDTVYADNAGNKTAYATADVTVAAGGAQTGAGSAAIVYMGLTVNTGAITKALANITLTEIAAGVIAAVNADPVVGKLVTASQAAAGVAIVFTSLIDSTNTTAPTVTITTATNSPTYTAGAATAGTAVTAGADTVLGGAGADVIIGGGGADVLTGGADADTFFFLKAHSVLGSLATITDYRATGMGSDVIVFGDITTLAGTTATVQDLSTSASLGAALNAAANTNTVGAGLSVFIWGGNTYVYVETTGATTTFVTTDALVVLTGTPFNTSTAIAGLGIDGV